jgi:uncharacterized protein YcbK (DUF882 family)
LSIALAAIAFALSVFANGQGSALPEERALKLLNIHTNEQATIVFKRNGRYDPQGLAKINSILRDWRRNQPTKMDPHLLDLIWDVYRQSGSRDYIHVVCGFRSPETNGMLRRRSKGVARNSQHMRGKAMDFFIPDVPLAKLREIGLRMQIGGVGFYPTSGSPFVHMDTGSVRHWPRMTRQQLVRIFPDGKTLHIPSDGKPLPGYAQALAAYKARQGGGETTLIASADEAPDEADAAPAKAGRPMALGPADSIDPEDEEIAAEPAKGDAAPPLARAKPVAVAAADAAPVPLPRFAPRSLKSLFGPDVAANAEPVPADQMVQGNSPIAVASIDAIGNLVTEAEDEFHGFDSASHWNATPVPANLANAMAARDVTRNASLPIPPTAVVATVDVTRPLRAEAITSAVLRDSDNPIRDVTPVLAYASSAVPIPPRIVREQPRVTADGVPIPAANPLRAPTVSPRSVAAPIHLPVAGRMTPSALTLTALDTQGLRIWIGAQSTRQKNYALLTMPDFGADTALMGKPELVFGGGFGDKAYRGLRTDRFSGPAAQPLILVDLRSAQVFAAR